MKDLNLRPTAELLQLASETHAEERRTYDAAVTLIAKGRTTDGRKLMATSGKILGLHEAVLAELGHRNAFWSAED